MVGVLGWWWIFWVPLGPLVGKKSNNGAIQIKLQKGGLGGAELPQQGMRYNVGKTLNPW